MSWRGHSGGGKSDAGGACGRVSASHGRTHVAHGRDGESSGARPGAVACPRPVSSTKIMCYQFARIQFANGSRGPPRQADLEEAERVCRDLGLGALLERMPGGMKKMVGETDGSSAMASGAVFPARALLSEADV